MQYDLAIIGAGWAGFSAAVRAKAQGLKVALIEKREIGGTCLNRGCIPTKTLLQSAKVYNLSKKARNFGIEISEPRVNFAEIQVRKEKIIRQLRQGMEFSLQGIELFSGEAKILSPQTIGIKGKELNAKFILIACGSKPMELAGLGFDGQKVLSSDEILDLKEVPRSLLIIGGGVIGCEFATLFHALGTQVTLVEKLAQLLPDQDKEIVKRLETIFKKRGIRVQTGSDALKTDLKSYALVLVCAGRIAGTQGLGLENIGIQVKRANLVVDAYLKTNVANIYGAGDCTGKIMLAHFAAYQGSIAAENIAFVDSAKKADNPYIPNCIFTDPEIASVGLTEEMAKSKEIDFKVHKFDFLGSGMARILDESEGFIKIISDKKTNQILGACLIGPRARELIATLTLAITSCLKVSAIKDTIFAHPSLSESIAEALK